jgi:hypothetical protein
MHHEKHDGAKAGELKRRQLLPKSSPDSKKFWKLIAGPAGWVGPFIFSATVYR